MGTMLACLCLRELTHEKETSERLRERAGDRREGNRSSHTVSDGDFLSYFLFFGTWLHCEAQDGSEIRATLLLQPLGSEVVSHAFYSDF